MGHSNHLLVSALLLPQNPLAFQPGGLIQHALVPPSCSVEEVRVPLDEEQQTTWHVTVP